MRGKLTRLAKEPLIQFLLIGAFIYGLSALYGTREDTLADRTIIVDETRIAGFINQWEARWNRPPTRQELDGVISAFVRENVLSRQALAMGLGEDDPITRRRLAQKLEFLTNDIALLKEPAEGELERYFQDHQNSYRDPDLVTFSHVFINPDLRGESTLDDAGELLAALQAAGIPDAATLDVGDRFMLPSYYREASELDIRRQLGSGFSAAVMQLVPGQWHGPVLSGYGTHLVYVYSIQETPLPQFADVQQAVLENWQTEQQETFNEEFFESLKSRYNIVIAEPPVEMLTEGRAADTNIRQAPGAGTGPES